MKMPKYEIFKGKSRWYWRLRGANGEKICVSQAFPTKWNAKRAAKKARALSRFALIKEI